MSYFYKDKCQKKESDTSHTFLFLSWKGEKMIFLKMKIDFCVRSVQCYSPLNNSDLKAPLVASFSDLIFLTAGLKLTIS